MGKLRVITATTLRRLLECNGWEIINISNTFINKEIIAICRSSSETRSSSFLVPDLVISRAGKMRCSDILRDRWTSMLPVPLNSSYITSSILLPVSTSDVPIIVRLPPNSIFLAAPKNFLGK